MDFTCDLNCPAKPTEKLCCEFCGVSYAYYKNNNNEQYWSEKLGFWGDGGCRLPRNMMPQQCRENDCRTKTWVVIRRWQNGKWADLAMHEVPEGQEVYGIGVRPKTSPTSLGYSRMDTRK